MKTKIYLLSVIFLSIVYFDANSQGVSINTDGSDPHASAMLDIQSTTAGLLVPRMTIFEVYSISAPADGLMVYSTTDHNFYYWSSASGWEKIIAGEDGDWDIDGNDMYNINTGNVGIGAATSVATHKLTVEDNNTANVLRLIGPQSYGYGAKLNFGDGEYAYIQEAFDDFLTVYGYSGLNLNSNYDVRTTSYYGNAVTYTPSGGTAINDNGNSPDASAILDVNSDTKGMLIPRMTTEQIQAISNPVNGLQVFNISDGFLYIFIESINGWKQVSYGTAGIYIPTFVSCGDDLTDTRDGQVYPTVDINGQCWMAANLNYGTMLSSGYNLQNNGTPEKYCYQNNPNYCENWGGLYQWNEMMNYNSTAGGQGLCPDGWHVPTDNEWWIMENFLDGSISSGSTGWRGSVAGAKLKNTGSGSYNWASSNGTNITGFTALPGGIRTTSGGTGFGFTNGVFFTSTLSSGYAIEREMYHSHGAIYRGNQYMNAGAAVRCLKD